MREEDNVFNRENVLQDLKFALSCFVQQSNNPQIALVEANKSVKDWIIKSQHALMSSEH